jgi:hypothetical protein
MTTPVSPASSLGRDHGRQRTWGQRGVAIVFALAVISLLVGWVPRRLWDTISWLSSFQTIGTVALALVLVFGPGLVWQAWRRSGFVSVLWPGPLVLALGGGLCWVGGGIVRPSSIADVWVAGLLLALGVTAWKLRPWERWSRLETGVLALVALTVIGVAAKAAFSGGPAGELYAGSISRTLEIGDRPDSRIPFCTVQMVAKHLAPYGPEASAYLAPYNFSHRGPLPGLAAAPIVLALGCRPRLELPDRPWVPFDHEGFAAYRIVLAALAAAALVAVAGLLVQLRGAAAAAMGAGLLALSPFFWHETFFTWPKLTTAAWVVGAFALILRRRTWLAGIAFGGAFLFHPMALLSLPFAGLWYLTQRSVPWRHRLGEAAGFSLGFAAVMGVWVALNHGHYGQMGFLQYLTSADGGAATWHTWWRSRLENFADTFLPFYVLAMHADHPSFNALGLRSDGVTQFFFQAWTALPFAVGLVTWLALLPAFCRGILRRPAAAWLVVLGPVLLIMIYYGATITGVMRECGHVFFLSGWIFLVWSAEDLVPKWIFSPGFLGLRGLEVLLMMFASSLIPASRTWSSVWALNDALWLAVSLAAVSLSAYVSWRLVRQAVPALAPGQTSA